MLAGSINHEEPRAQRGEVTSPRCLSKMSQRSRGGPRLQIRVREMPFTSQMPFPPPPCGLSAPSVPGGRLGQSSLLAHRWESSQVVTRPAQVCLCGTTPCRGDPRVCMRFSRQKPLHLGKWLSLPPSPAPQVFWSRVQAGGKGEKERRVGRRRPGEGSELGGRQRRGPTEGRREASEPGQGEG